MRLASIDVSEQLKCLHGSGGIYQLTIPGAEPHFGWTSNLSRRLSRILLKTSLGTESPLSRLRTRVTAVECWRTGSRLETSLLLYELTRISLPDSYRKLLKLRVPWFVGLWSGDGFTRTDISNRIGPRSEAQFGPFATRSLAQSYEAEVLSLFQIRRCTETLHPAADHPGCIYGEMNQCLRPCQEAVSTGEYQSEVNRLREFLDNNGRSAVAALSAARDRAAEQTDFEQAALLHKRIERIKTTAALRDPVIAGLHGLNGLALTASAEAAEFVLWPMLGARWNDPIRLAFRMEERKGISLDRELRDVLETKLLSPSPEADPSEHLAIFARWYYSSWRDGTWFPFQTVRDLNYRKLVREISKLAASAGKGRATQSC